MVHRRRRPPHTRPLLPLLLGLAACAGRAPDRAATPTVGPLEQAPVNLDLTLRLSDPSAATTCPEDSFAWPGCEPLNALGYSNFYEVGEPLVYSFAPAAVYDLEAAPLAPDGTPAGPSVRAPSVTIGASASTVDVPFGPHLLRFTLQADPPGRPDGDICALGRAASDGGSSTDPRVTCRVVTPDGRTFEETAFHREALYWSLMTDLCEAGVSMLESDFAQRFQCDDPVGSPSGPEATGGEGSG